MKGGGRDKYEQYTSTITSSYADPVSQDDCIGINFTTTLKNIQSAFHTQKVGEILEIKLENINVLRTYSDSGDYCGDISSSYNGNLVKCLRNRREFSAKILNKSGSVQVYNI